MNVSMNGLRRRLAMEYNNMAQTELTPGQKEIMQSMRMYVGGLLAVYNQDDPDFIDMSECVSLISVEE